MSPIVGLPLVTIATLTVNSWSPAKYSCVPSRGSTKTTSAHGTECLTGTSSDTTGTSGSSRDRPPRMTAFAASSALVRADPSAFMRHSTLDRSIATMAAAARDTMSVSSSIPSASATLESGVWCGILERARCEP
jgi:hypothetical protein